MLKNFLPKFKRNLIVSYPKSGRTLLRYMLCFYYCKINLIKIKSNEFEAENHIRNKLFKSVNYSHLSSNIRLGLKYYDITHNSQVASNWGGGLKNLNCVFLYRNCLPLLQSSYFHAIHRVNTFKGTPSDFIRSSEFGIIKIITFYNIFLNINKNHFKKILTINYEDLVKNKKVAFRKIINFLGWNLNEEILQETILESSFEKMQIKSISEKYKNTPIAPINSNDPNSFKVRKNPNNVEEIFNQSDLKFMREMIDQYLDDKNDLLKIKQNF